jgi:hypothetical protein
MARFTVLTDRVIRMEYSKTPNAFEDHATIAMMNRNLPVPQFTQATNGGVLTIKTGAVQLTYAAGQAFSAASLSVVSLDQASAFKSWTYGQAFPGNLLGTIRGLDQQDNTPLNWCVSVCACVCVRGGGLSSRCERASEMGVQDCGRLVLYIVCWHFYCPLLSCSTQNVLILDNGEYNHCEWGMVSRDGWVVYDDTENYILDSNDWCVPLHLCS